MSLKPNDLGRNIVLENLRKLKVEDCVRSVKKGLKKALVEAELEVAGVRVELVTSKTRFGGERLWFACPRCGRRCGVLYRASEGLKCRKCVGGYYKGERYKGMVEVL